MRSCLHLILPSVTSFNSGTLLTHLWDFRTGQATMSSACWGSDSLKSSIRPTFLLSFQPAMNFDSLNSSMQLSLPSFSFFSPENVISIVFCIFISIDSQYLNKYEVLLIYKILINVKDLSSIGSKMQIVKQNLLESSHSYVCTPNIFLEDFIYARCCE